MPTSRRPLVYDGWVRAAPNAPGDLWAGPERIRPRSDMYGRVRTGDKSAYRGRAPAVIGKALTSRLIADQRRCAELVERANARGGGAHADGAGRRPEKARGSAVAPSARRAQPAACQRQRSRYGRVVATVVCGCASYTSTAWNCSSKVGPSRATPLAPIYIQSQVFWCSFKTLRVVLGLSCCAKSMVVASSRRWLIANG